eukprot:jgi/Mesvir1/6178/Mv00867-RA.1
MDGHPPEDTTKGGKLPEVSEKAGADASTPEGANSIVEPSQDSSAEGSAPGTNAAGVDGSETTSHADDWRAADGDAEVTRGEGDASCGDDVKGDEALREDTPAGFQPQGSDGGEAATSSASTLAPNDGNADHGSVPDAGASGGDPEGALQGSGDAGDEGGERGPERGGHECSVGQGVSSGDVSHEAVPDDGSASQVDPSKGERCEEAAGAERAAGGEEAAAESGPAPDPSPAPTTHDDQAVEGKDHPHDASHEEEQAVTSPDQGSVPGQGSAASVACCGHDHPGSSPGGMGASRDKVPQGSTPVGAEQGLGLPMAAMGMEARSPRSRDASPRTLDVKVGRPPGPLSPTTLGDTRQWGSFGPVRPPRESGAAGPSPIRASLAPAPLVQPVPRHLLAVLEKKQQLQQQGGGEEGGAVGDGAKGGGGASSSPSNGGSGSMFGVWKPDPVHMLGVAHLDDHVKHRNVNVNLVASEGHPGDPLAQDPVLSAPRHRDAFPGVGLGDCKNRDRDGARSSIHMAVPHGESGAIHLAPISPPPVRQHQGHIASPERRRNSLGALSMSGTAHLDLLRRASRSPPQQGPAAGAAGEAAPRDDALSLQSSHRVSAGGKLVAFSHQTLELDTSFAKPKAREKPTSPAARHTVPRSLAPLQDAHPSIRLPGDGPVSPLGGTFSGSGQQGGSILELQGQGHVPGYQHPSFSGKPTSPTGSAGSFWSQKNKLGKVLGGPNSPPPVGSSTTKPGPIAGLVLDASRRLSVQPLTSHSP